jgi:hypothetical protein
VPKYPPSSVSLGFWFNWRLVHLAKYSSIRDLDLFVIRDRISPFNHIFLVALSFGQPSSLGIGLSPSVPIKSLAGGMRFFVSETWIHCRCYVQCCAARRWVNCVTDSRAEGEGTVTTWATDRPDTSRTCSCQVHEECREQEMNGGHSSFFHWLVVS